MGGSRQSGRAGFTLIEVLAAALIMMLMGGLILTGLNVARRRSRGLHARRDIMQISMAWQGYYAEYGRFPADFAGGPEITESDRDMVLVLRGTHAANPRGVPFMDFHAQTQQMLDPWGTRYRIALDTTYMGEVQVVRGASSETLPMMVAVWSAGEDREFGTAADILGWREEVQ